MASGDGGRTWRVVGRIAGADLSGGQFLSRRRGYAWGGWLAPQGSELGAIWRTTDGGRSWRRVTDGTYTVAALAMRTAAAGERIVTSTVGPSSLWQRTGDGGRTWTTILGLPWAWAYARPAAALTPAGSALALLAGARGSTLRFAPAAGAPWRLAASIRPSFPPGGDQPALAAEGSCAALSMGSVLYASRDGGARWRRVGVTGGLIEAIALEPGCVLVTSVASGATRTGPLPD